MKIIKDHIVENTNNKPGESNTKDKVSLPFLEEKDKIKSSEPIKKIKSLTKRDLHKKSLLKAPSNTQKLKAIIEEDNGVREAIKKGKIKKS